MKTRRVLVTLEIETDAPLAELRNVKSWREATEFQPCAGTMDFTLHQVQANVIRPSRAPAAKKRRGRK